MPSELITGHELIHFWREITGRHNSGTAYHWVIGKDNFSNDIIEYNFVGNIEEYRTVGVGNSTKDRASNIGVYGNHNRPDDITMLGTIQDWCLILFRNTYHDPTFLT